MNPDVDFRHLFVETKSYLVNAAQSDCDNERDVWKAVQLYVYFQGKKLNSSWQKFGLIAAKI